VNSKRLDISTYMSKSEETNPPRKQRGRPKGSKNKINPESPPVNNTQPEVKDIFTVLSDYCEDLTKSRDMQKIESLNNRLEKAYFQEHHDITSQLKFCENVLGENLEDFLVVGHTFDGSRVRIFKASRPKDVDSLREAAKQIVLPFLMSGQQEENEY